MGMRIFAAVCAVINLAAVALFIYNLKDWPDGPPAGRVVMFFVNCLCAGAMIGVAARR